MRETVDPSSTTADVFKLHQSTSETWRTESPKNRIQRLKKLKQWIETNRKEIQEALYKDFKKPPEEVDLSEIYVVLSEIKHAIQNLSTWTKPLKTESSIALVGSKSFVYHEPKGTSLIISPWNFPLNLSLGPLVSALAAGCTAILKPSELTPNCAAIISRMAADIFNPSEVAVFQGDKKVAENLLQLPFDQIFFTGSPAVGKIVMRKASMNLSAVTLELGGKCPVIIDETADLEDAAEKIVWGKYLNCGQTCIAPDYLLVPKLMEEALLENIGRAIDQYFDPEGLGIEFSSSYARIIDQKHFARLELLLNEGLDQGAKLEYGGVCVKSERYIAPTILSKVPVDSSIMEQEIFGPILPVISYEHIEEAITLIKSKSKPLALYIFSKSTPVQNRITKEISSGSVGINDCVVQFMNPNLPFGGIGQSGFGKSHGYHGFLAFSNQKSVLKQKTGLTSVKPLFPPYTELTKKAIDFLLKYL